MQDFSFKGADTSKHQTTSRPAPGSKHELPAFTVKSPATQKRSQEWDLDIGGETAQRYPAAARQTYAVDSDEEATLKREIAALREEATPFPAVRHRFFPAECDGCRPELCRAGAQRPAGCSQGIKTAGRQLD